MSAVTSCNKRTRNAEKGSLSRMEAVICVKGVASVRLAGEGAFGQAESALPDDGQREAGDQRRK